MIGQTVSHYRIHSKLGEGGMGVVYLAEDTRLGRNVALKFLSPALSMQDDAKKRFVNEAKAASSLDHSNICPIYEIDEAPDGRLFIVMPHYAGASLQEKISKGPMDMAEAVDIARQLASGLASAHEQGIVHRDMKPGNVLLTGDGQAKIVDFGLAKLATHTRVTKSGMRLGTVAYMSPEQARGLDVDARSDIYSLGVVLYEMLTGRLPFRGQHEAAILYAVLNEEPEAVTSHQAEVPEELVRIIERAMAKDITRRYQSASEMAFDLAALGGVPGGRSPSGASGRTRTTRRNRWLGAAVVALAVAAVALLFLARHRDAANEEWAIAVVDFRDLAGGGDPTLSAGITSLVQVGLVQSSPMRVISPSYLYDLRRRLFGEERGAIEEGQALELARKAGASVLLSGEITNAGNDRIVVWHLVNTQNGRSLAAKRIDGGELTDIADEIVESVLPMLARKSGVAEVPQSQTVASLTTASPAAYQRYVAGRLAADESRVGDAIREYRQAITLDSTFALAYVELAHNYHFHFQMNDDARAYADRAWSLRARLGIKDRMRLEAYRSSLRSRSDEATATYREMLDRWPDDRDALFGLAQILFFHWSVREADEVVTRARTLYPDDDRFAELHRSVLRFECRFPELLDLERGNVREHPENPAAWVGLGMAFWHLGMPDSAEAALQEATAIDAGFVPARWGAPECDLLRGEVDVAIEEFEAILENERIEPAQRMNFLTGNSWWYPGLITAYCAAGQYEQAIGACALLPSTDAQYRSGVIQLRAGRPGRALQLARGLAVPMDETGVRHPSALGSRLELEGIALVAMDSLDSARRLVRELATMAEQSDDRSWRPSVALIEARIAIAEGGPQEALKILSSAENVFPICILPSSWIFMDWMETRARAYELARNVDEAVRTLEALAGAQPYLGSAYYDLGRLYERKGRTADAVSAYEKFLNLWKNADSGLPQVADAQKRLTSLRASR